MQSMMHSIFNTLMRMTGLNALADMSTAGIVTLAVTSILTFVWLIGLNKTVRRVNGVLGGPALAIGTTAVAVTVAFGIITMIIQMALGMVVGAVGGIPLIGPPLAKMTGFVLGFVVKFVLMIFAFQYAVKNLDRMGKWFMHTIGKPFQQGHNKIHLLAGALMSTLIINNPAFNAGHYFIPAILSALIGIYTLVVVRPKWSEIEWSTAKEYVKAYGELPNGRKAETAEDERLLREAYQEIEDYLNGNALRDRIEEKCKTKVRIAAQLELFEAEAEAEAEAETQEERHTHLH